MLLGLCLCLGCRDREGAYAHRLDDDRLARLLLDLQFAEVTLTGLEPSAKDSLRARYWNALGEIYQMPPERLREEVRRLEMDPKHHLVVIGKMTALHDSIR